MLALAVEDAFVKPFMNRLLRESLFDAFETRQVELISRTRVTIGGEAETSGFISWLELKPMLTEIIKFEGKPKFLKIIFSLGGQSAAEVHNNAKALFLNLTYENNGVSFTTAVAQKEFALDKSLDAVWDNYIMGFFEQNKVSASTRLR